MNKYIILIILSCFLQIGISSCEKTELNFEEEEEKENVISIDHDGYIETQGAVDLGLSVNWAAVNLDSYYGLDEDFFGSEFNFSTLGESSCPYPEIGGTVYDHATSLLGEGWQTPSKAQWQELFSKCRVTFKEFFGVQGYVVTGTTYKAIFLPLNFEEIGYDYHVFHSTNYWSSTTVEDGASQAWSVNFSNTGNDYNKYNFLKSKTSKKAFIRPVQKK